MDSSLKARGAIGESLAAAYLQLLGYQILRRNHRYGGVEIDIVARDTSCLVLVEVKTRNSSSVDLIDSLRQPQLQRYRRAASVLLPRFAWAAEIRIDWVGIQVCRAGLRLRHDRGVTGF